MEELQIKNAIRGFLKAWTNGEIGKAASYFADNAVWITPQGTFKGKVQIEKFADWVYQGNKNFTITETSAGILVHGDFAAVEHDLSGILNGRSWKVPSACIWEFKDGKAVSCRTYLDVLSQAQQVSPGGIAKTAVNAVIKASRKGL